MKRKLIPIYISVLTASVLFGAGSENTKDKTLVFEKFAKPWINDSQFLNINGEATIDCAFLFNEEGYVDDWIPIRTNDIKLIQSIRNVVELWKIKPPVYNGEPYWSYMEFKIRFVHEGAVVSLSPIETFMAATGSMRDDFQLLVPFSELDSIPKPIKMETPKLSPKLTANSKGETVKFEFFIDQNGKVRIPIIKEDFNTEVMAAAIMLESLLKWEFEPPTKNGKPVATRAVIPFRIP